MVVIRVANRARFENRQSKVGCIVSKVIWSAFHMGQYRDDHREDALHFTSFVTV